MKHLSHLPASIERFEEMPDGWRIDETWGSPDHEWIPICNGKSLLNGGRKGLLRWRKPAASGDTPKRVAIVTVPEAKPSQPSVDEINLTATTVNQLARARFKEMLLKDLLIDLTICKIEGWCSRQYVKELKALLDGVHEKITGSNF